METIDLLVLDIVSQCLALLILEIANSTYKLGNQITRVEEVITGPDRTIAAFVLDLQA
jgi:hypothetical protein